MIENEVSDQVDVEMALYNKRFAQGQQVFERMEALKAKEQDEEAFRGVQVAKAMSLRYVPVNLRINIFVFFI